MVAQVGNWIGEAASLGTSGELLLGGQLPGFTSFASAIGVGEEAWYAIVDGENREAGVGTLVSPNVFERTTVMATLVDGVYNDASPPAIVVSGLVSIYCTFNKSAFEMFIEEAPIDGTAYARQDEGWVPTVAGAGVDSVFTRTGHIVALEPDYAAFYALIVHAHTESDITDLDKYTKAEVDALIGGIPGAPVDSVFGRVGAIVALQPDYAAFYADIAHNHDGVYSPVSHTHDKLVFGGADIVTTSATGASVTGALFATDYMSAPIFNGPNYANGGTEAVPPFSFGGDVNTGMYQAAPNVIGFTCDGTQVGNLDPLGFTLPAAPTLAMHAATKQYVDDNAGGGAVTSVFTRTGAVVAAAGDYSAFYLGLGGGTLTGALTLFGAPTTDLMAATKKYVDDNVAAGGVSSFNTRVGAVVPVLADYQAFYMDLTTDQTINGIKTFQQIGTPSLGINSTSGDQTVAFNTTDAGVGVRECDLVISANIFLTDFSSFTLNALGGVGVIHSLNGASDGHLKWTGVAMNSNAFNAMLPDESQIYTMQATSSEVGGVPNTLLLNILPNVFLTTDAEFQMSSVGASIFHTLKGDKDGLLTWKGEQLVPAANTTLNMLSDTDLDTEGNFPDDGERLAFDALSGKWVPRRSTSALGIVTMNYRWSSPVNLAPSAGSVSTDNADPTLVTMIYINKEGQGAGAPDYSLYFENIGVGDWFNMADRSNAGQKNSYDVTGAPVLNGTIWEIPVVFFEQLGGNFTNNQTLLVAIRYTSAGVTDHTNLTSIGTNTHAQIDTHIGTANIHFADAPADGSPYNRQDNAWISAASGGIPEAPQDGTPYERQNAAWVPALPGAKGDTGDTGPAGPAGADGLDGAPGAKGDTGDTGATGAQGPAGADGADSTVPGPEGPQGIQGPAGAAGADGADSTVPGPQGDPGTPGADGADGATGAQGPAGPTAISADAGNLLTLGGDSLTFFDGEILGYGSVNTLDGVGSGLKNCTTALVAGGEVTITCTGIVALQSKILLTCSQAGQPFMAWAALGPDTATVFSSRMDNIVGSGGLNPVLSGTTVSFVIIA